MPATPIVPPAAALARERIDLAPERDREAWIAWGRHVDAGRIGAPPLSPLSPTPPAETRLASLAAILGGTSTRRTTGRPA